MVVMRVVRHIPRIMGLPATDLVFVAEKIKICIVSSSGAYVKYCSHCCHLVMVTIKIRARRDWFLEAPLHTKVYQRTNWTKSFS